jgi:hypothetical protein
MRTPEDEAFDDLAKRQGDWGGGFQAKRAAAADKQKPAQEPVAWADDNAIQGKIGNVCSAEARRYWEKSNWADKKNAELHKHPLYTTPPKRPWVGLTDDELADLWYKESLDWMEFARAHEAKLKEKNT